MNEGDEKALRRDFRNKFPGLEDAGSFGRVQQEIRRLEKGRVNIPASDPRVVGSAFNGSPEIRMFAAACRSVFYGKPPEALDEQGLLCRAILDGRKDPSGHVKRLVAKQTEAIRKAREEVKARPEHQRIKNEDAELGRILEGHESA